MKCIFNFLFVVGFDVINILVLLVIIFSCDILFFIWLMSFCKLVKWFKFVYSVDIFNEFSWFFCLGLVYLFISICFILCSLLVFWLCNRIWCFFCVSILVVLRFILLVVFVIKIVFMCLFFGNWLMFGLI